METREGRMVTRLWAARQLEESRWEVVERAFALASGGRGAFREEWEAREGAEVIARGDENTRIAAKAATTTHLALDTQEATR